MIKTNWILALVNIVFILINNILIALGFFQRSNYDAGAIVVVLLCTLGSIYILRNIVSIRWFGQSVDGDHTSNITVGKIFSFLCLFPPTIMNLHPYVKELMK